MHESYDDIKQKLGQPQWWDENAVPRYCDFHPKRCGVYIDRAVLMAIDCQGCKLQFRVAMTWSQTAEFMESVRTGKPCWTSEPKSGWAPWYGDPPAHGCVGDTMSSGTVEVLEVWQRPGADWERDGAEELAMQRGLK